MFGKLNGVLKSQGILLHPANMAAVERALTERAGGFPAAALEDFAGVRLEVDETGHASLVVSFERCSIDGQPVSDHEEKRIGL